MARLSLAYGTADVLAQGINFLLVPLYLAFLTPENYGALALLLLLSTFLKILFRLGLDAGFLRIFYDLKEDQQSRFAGTVALFSAGFASTAFVLVWIFSTEVSRALFENADGSAGASAPRCPPSMRARNEPCHGPRSRFDYLAALFCHSFY